MLRKNLSVFLAAILSSAAYSQEDFSLFERDAEVVRLEESVITAERFETNVRNTPKNITIITSEDIEKKKAKNIVEALEGVPGVKASNAFGFGSIDLRGQGEANHSNTLILVDGIRQNPVTMGGARINNIAIENIERIEVIPGGGSVLYGDGAVGGVVNIITKTAAKSEGYKSIFTEAGNNDILNYGFNYGDNITDKLLLQLNYSDRNDGGYRENGEYDAENVEVSLKYLLSNSDSVSLKYGNYKEKYGLPGSISPADIAEDRRKTNYPDRNADYIIDSYTMSYNKKINDCAEFIIDGNFKKTDYESSTYLYDLSEYSVKPKLKLSYENESHIIFGYDYFKGESDVEYGYNTVTYSYGELDRELEKTSNGIFAQNTYNFGNFQFVQGVRYEETDYDLYVDQSLEPGKTYVDDTQYNTSYDLSLNYLYSDTGSTYISFTKGFRTPNTDELAKASDDIKEQTHKYIEVGVKDMIFNSFISASVFKGIVEDEIYYDKSCYPYKNANLDGENEKLGVELFLEHYLGKLTLKETFTYLDTEMLDGPYEGKTIPGVSKYRYSLGADYTLSENFRGNVAANYYGSAYCYGDYNNQADKVDPYMTVDAKLTYDFKNGLEIYTGINNIFNEEYYDYAGYYYYSGDVYYYYPAPERTYYAGARYNF